MVDLLENTQIIFDNYEKRFMKALIGRKIRKPWESSDRDIILSETKKVIGYQDIYVPSINEQVMDEIVFENYKVQMLMFESWENCYGTASLYIPEGEGKRPLIIICCGHGEGGRLNPGYQAMARRLVRQGAYVLVPDNIGQGEREFMGHKDLVAPFYCGLSVQGLIVMETSAWINKMAEKPFVDELRIGACGNSGGGTLTLFLSALQPKIAALSSSGYPSSFWWVAAKEKRHCHCNIIPNVIPRLEMWEIYSLFAPRPVYLTQGKDDHYFPEDLFYKNARNVYTTYMKLSAQDNFNADVLPGQHPWDNERREKIGNFFSKALAIAAAEVLEADVLDTIDPFYKTGDFPDDAINANELSQRLTGIKMPEGTKLWDIYKPRYKDHFLTSNDLVKSIERGEVMQILSQFEAFL